MIYTWIILRCYLSIFSEGSAWCECDRGFIGSGSDQCDDIDECATGQVCSTGQLCENKPGGYECIDQSENKIFIQYLF